MADSDAVRGSGDENERTGPVTFVRQAIAELRKVVWPTQEQLVTYFIVVMVFVIALMTLVSLLDLGFGKLIFEILATNTKE
ncbi:MULTISPECIES: preprotein translocase subunit SecE [unclassified Nocardioides]|uniref:preprotein translocase subunit SecE n=1 Tax=unclassified Nocardioides TaxID=2615069 RepID=UPI000700419B|nr:MULTISPECIES: preprotein translocase subunit SecE [unclassified Nocardioides]KQY57683.1 preprotein translocase subunit SecE [Nocardioides sp. Root140]KQZ67673.1 preprotein translocase subunit SecE [Nocardioides sp. Root151]KRF13219.1 preprotein translocase subunit SecE [Nocardioides sp. Soil796]